MDISTLELPLRTSKKPDGLFGLRPPLSSVNVCYETAEADSPLQSHALEIKKESLREPETPPPAVYVDRTSDDSDGSDQKSNDDTHHNVLEVSASPQHSPPTPFPVKETVSSQQSQQSVQRLSFSGLASDECQTFIKSLKEPKYAKPLTADEISWLFQDFYVKLHQDLVGNSDESAGKELLSVAEQEAQKQQLQHIDAIVDRAERAVAGGELYSKLFSLGGSHDSKLQARITVLREHQALLDLVVQKLELDPAILNELTVAKSFLNRLNRENAPKAKIQALIRAHQALVEATDTNGSADTLIPVFVMALITSQVLNWWQTFLFITRFRRESAINGQAAYCLTNFEAAIHLVENLTFEEQELPDDVDSQLFSKPISSSRANRERSESQSSRTSTTTTNSLTGSFGQRINDTLSTYRNIFATRRRSHTQPPTIDQRFLNSDPDSLTIGDVRALHREYRRLAEYIERSR